MIRRGPLLLALVWVSACNYYCGRPCDPEAPECDGFCAADGFCVDVPCARAEDCPDDGSCFDGFCRAGVPFDELRFDSVSVGQGVACGRALDGRLLCWGAGDAADEGIIDLVDDPISEFAAGNGFVCFRSEAGIHGCVGLSDAIPAPPVEALIAARDRICSLRSGDGVCTGDGPLAPASNGDGSALDAWRGEGTDRVCVVASGSVACNPGLNLGPVSFSSGQVVDVAVNADGVCVSLSPPSVRGFDCSTAPLLAIAERFAPSTPLAAGDGFVCGLDRTGRLVCNDDALNEQLVEARPAGALGASFDAGGDTLCWIEAGEILCASLSPDSDPVMTEPRF